MTQEALRMALEALEKLWDIIDDIDTYSDMAKADEKLYRSLVERRQRKRFEETGITTDGYELSGGAITAIKEALAQPEPVIDKSAAVRIATSLGWTPQSTWVGLTDEEELKLAQDSMGKSRHWLVAQVEAKLEEKNT